MPPKPTNRDDKGKKYNAENEIATNSGSTPRKGGSIRGRDSVRKTKCFLGGGARPNCIWKSSQLSTIKVFCSTYLGASLDTFKYHAESIEAVHVVTFFSGFEHPHQLMDSISLIRCHTKMSPYGMKFFLGMEEGGLKGKLVCEKAQNGLEEACKNIHLLKQEVLDEGKRKTLEHTKKKLTSELQNRLVLYQIICFCYGCLEGNVFHKNISKESKRRYWSISCGLTAKFAKTRKEYLQLACKLCMRFEDLASIGAQRGLLNLVYDGYEDLLKIQMLREFAITQALAGGETVGGSIARCFGHILASKPKNKNNFNSDCHNSADRRSNPDILWWNMIRGNAFQSYFMEFRSTGEQVKLLMAPDEKDDKNNRTCHKKQIPTGIGDSSSLIAGDWALNRKRSAIKARAVNKLSTTTSLSPCLKKRKIIKQPHGHDFNTLIEDEERLKHLHIASMEDLNQCCYSDLTILKDEDGIALHMEQSPADVYLSYPLLFYQHKRVVIKVLTPGVYQSPKVSGRNNLYIDADMEDHIDKHHDMLHVSRQRGGKVYKEMGGLNLRLSIGALFRALGKKGKPCKFRSPNSYRFNFGVGGNWSYNAKTKKPSIVGIDDLLEGLGCGAQRDSVLEEILDIAEFVWKCGQEFLRQAGKKMMGGQRIRKEFVREFRCKLGAKKEFTFEWEFVTIAVMEIFPDLPTNNYHRDIRNPKEAETCQTGAFNLVVKDPSTGQLFLLQFLFNFRQSLSDYVRRTRGVLYCESKTLSSLSQQLNEIALGNGSASQQRPSKNSSSMSYCPTRTNSFKKLQGYRLLPPNFYYILAPQEDNDCVIESIEVLPNAEGRKKLEACIDLGETEAGGKLHDLIAREWFGKSKTDISICCHVEDATDTMINDGSSVNIRIFEGHSDKDKFPWAIFLPLSGRFWLYVCVPDDVANYYGADHRDQYQEWIDKLDSSTRDILAEFEAHVLRGSLKDMGKANKNVLIIHCCPGTMVKFPANSYWHATLSFGSQQRNLMVLHPAK